MVASKRKGRGGQPKYSAFAIETCLTLGLIFHQPLRQTKRFVRSLLGLMGVELPVTDFPNLSQRANGLSVVDDRLQSSGPIPLIVESTGLNAREMNRQVTEKQIATKSLNLTRLGRALFKRAA